MFTVTATITRPNTSINWFSDSPDGALLLSGYDDPAVISKNFTTSEDGLVKTFELTYDSYDSYQSWIANLSQADNAIFLKRNEYIIANGFTLKIEESIDGGAKVIEKLL